MGKFWCTKSELDRKNIWDNNYANTQIARIRCGGSKEDVINNIMSTLLDYNYRKKVYLVVNFLSKSHLETEFKKLKDDPRAPAFIKTIWGSGYVFIGDDDAV